MNSALRISVWARSIGFALILMGCGAASAQGIIHFAPSPPIFYGPNVSQIDIDVNGDSVADFILRSEGNFLTTLEPIGNNRLIAYPEPPPDLGSLLLALPQGHAIGSSLDPVLQWYDRNTDAFHSVGVADMVTLGNQGSIIGFFTGLPSAYAGFDLNYDGASHYGWFQISNPLNIAAGQFVDWAYETSPNTPITAGAVPEPSAAALFLAAIASLWFLRKRL